MAPPGQTRENEARDLSLADQRQRQLEDIDADIVLVERFREEVRVNPVYLEQRQQHLDALLAERLEALRKVTARFEELQRNAQKQEQPKNRSNNQGTRQEEDHSMDKQSRPVKETCLHSQRWYRLRQTRECERCHSMTPNLVHNCPTCDIYVCPACAKVLQPPPRNTQRRGG